MSKKTEKLAATEAEVVVEPKVKKSKAEKPKAGKKLRGTTKSKSQYLGGKLIVRSGHRTVNGKEFNDIILSDGTGILLSDKDLAAQVSSEQGELVH